MDDPTASTPLMVSVAPSSSSFFAGEHFSCVITFTNTRVPLPSTQPLPSTSTFGNGNGSHSSLSDAACIAAAQRRVFSSAPALGRSSHTKSQSVDVRTFARQLQLEGADEGARDEGYYKAKRLAAESVDSFESQQNASVLDSSSIPSRRRLIGRDKHAAAHGHAANTFSAQLSTPTSAPASSSTAAADHKGHKHAASMYATPDHSSRNKNQAGLGLGLPGPSHRPPFASPDPSGPTSARPTLNLIHPSSSSVGSPTPARMASGAFRQPSAPVPRTHPHGRKQSIAAVQAEDLSAAFALGAPGMPASSAPSSAAPPITEEEPASPSFSNEPSTPRAIGHTFYQAGQGANDTMESVLRDDISAWSRPGIGPGGSGQSSGNSSGLDISTPTSFSSASTPYGAPKSSPLFPSGRSYAPGTVSLLWSFAQFGGEFKVDESLIKPGEFEQVKKRLAMDRTIGGGHLASSFGGAHGTGGGGGIGAQLDGGDEDAQKAGWGSYLSSALFSRPARRAHGRSVSSIGDRQARTLQNRAVPLFSSPPSIVAVDLDLKPGESRSYSFRIPLPADLPPSYTGRAISFTYTLTLGTNRVDHAAPRSAGSNGRFAQSQGSKQQQRSRLIRIPLRIYNHISVSGATHFFDLTNPVVYRKDESVVREELDDMLVTPTLRSSPVANGPRQDSAAERSRAKSQGREQAFGKSELEEYARDLLLSTRANEAALDDEDAPTDVEAAASAAASAARDLLFAPDPTASPPTSKKSLSRSSSMNLPRPTSPLGRRASVAASAAGEEDDGPKTSMEAVEHLSRNSQKVSYDISKDGQIVAVLTLIKSKYRLGDTVSGVVTMNRSGSVARVVRIAATLESYEAIQSDLSTLPQNRVAKLTKVVHSECHQSTLDSGQASFALPIPSGATPDFVTSAVKINWTVRLSFLTLACVRPSKGGPRAAPPCHLIPVESDGYEHFHASLVAVPHLSGPLHPSLMPTLSKEGREEEKEESASMLAPEGTKLEVVECAVPLNVLPHSTRFQPGAASVFA